MRPPGAKSWVAAGSALVGLAGLAVVLSGCSAGVEQLKASTDQHLLHAYHAPVTTPNPTTPDSTYLGNTIWADLKVGDCLDDVAAANYSNILGLDVVGCSASHDSEISARPELKGTVAWPGAALIEREVNAACNAAFTTYVGVPVESTDLDYTFYPPTRNGWRYASDRHALCIVYRVKGELRDSVRGVGMPGLPLP